MHESEAGTREGGGARAVRRRRLRRRAPRLRPPARSDAARLRGPLPRGRHPRARPVSPSRRPRSTAPSRSTTSAPAIRCPRWSPATLSRRWAARPTTSSPRWPEPTPPARRSWPGSRSRPSPADPDTVLDVKPDTEGEPFDRIASRACKRAARPLGRSSATSSSSIRCPSSRSWIAESLLAVLKSLSVLRLGHGAAGHASGRSRNVAISRRRRRSAGVEPRPERLGTGAGPPLREHALRRDGAA